MHSLIVVSALLAIAAASPALLPLEPVVYSAQSPVRSQYHSQDGLGQYNYGYNGDLSSKVESRSADGVTRGSYNYVDANGRVQTVQYTADDSNGFRALATNLPNAPVDSAAAPEPVRDTPEVAIAKAEHYRAYNEAALRAAAAPDNSIAAFAPAAFAPAAFAPAAFAPAAFAPAPVLAFRSDSPASFSYSTAINGNALAVPAIPRATIFQSGPVYAQAPIAFAHGSSDPLDTPEVAAAKAEHLAAVERQKALLAASH